MPASFQMSNIPLGTTPSVCATSATAFAVGNRIAIGREYTAQNGSMGVCRPSASSCQSCVRCASDANGPPSRQVVAVDPETTDLDPLARIKVRHPKLHLVEAATDTLLPCAPRGVAPEADSPEASTPDTSHASRKKRVIDRAR